MTPPRTCFLISPIGKQGSDANQRSRRLLEQIIHPTMERFGFQVFHFLENDYQNDQIRREMLEWLGKASVCIADLTGNNPNVLIEYGWRRAANLPVLPVVHVEHTGELLFDVSDFKTAFYDFANPGAAVAEIERFLQHKGFGVPQVCLGPDRSNDAAHLFGNIVRTRARRVDILQVGGIALAQELQRAVDKCADTTFCILLMQPQRAAQYAAKEAHSSDIRATVKNILDLRPRAHAYNFELPTIGIWYYRHEPSIAAVMVDDSYLQLGWYVRDPSRGTESGLALKGHDQPFVGAYGQAARAVLDKVRTHFRSVWRQAEPVPNFPIGPEAGVKALMAEWMALRQGTAQVA